jgi:diguanylate cyclase (GGDEF)-like protein
MILLGAFFILRKALHVQETYRSQVVTLSLGALCPFLVNVAYTFHLIPGIDVNYDPAGFVLAGIFLTMGVFRYRLFDLRPVARRLLIENMGDGMLVFNDRDQLIDINPAGKRILASYPGPDLGEKAEELFPPDSQIPTFLAQDQKSQIELSLTRDEPNSTFSLQLFPLRVKNSVVGKMLVFHDITQQKALENQLRDMAIHDQLTGIHNRFYFFDLGNRAFKRALRYQHQLSLVMCDLDHFKQVNDKFGHVVGDQILQEFVALVREEVRQRDVFARYGGDEFILLLQETNREGAMRFSERLRAKVEKTPLETRQGPISITISSGVSTLQVGRVPSLEHLIDLADQALYISKERGRNRVTYQNPEEADAQDGV